MSVCIERALVDRHFDGIISPRDERQLRQHLPTCAACQQYYDRHLLLADLDPLALEPEERIGRGLGLKSPAATTRRRWLPIGAVASTFAVAAAVLLFARSPIDDGFTARGGAHAHQETLVNSRVFIYDVHAGSRLVHSGDSLGQGNELAFAYQNDLAKKRLMIFGVDEHQHIYWFYPAWRSETEDPVAVPIATDAVRHELPDAVRHAVDGSRLDVHAVFLDTPLTVRQAETMIAHDPNGRLSVSGSVESTTSLTVTPTMTTTP